MSGPPMRDMRHERGLDRILDDLRSILTDLDGGDWPDAVDDAMNTTWDRLLKLGGPDE